MTEKDKALFHLAITAIVCITIVTITLGVNSYFQKKHEAMMKYGYEYRTLPGKIGAYMMKAKEKE